MRILYSFIALLFVNSSHVHAEVIEGIACIVNDEVIALSDLRQYKSRLQAGRLADDLLIENEQVKASVLKDDKKLLELMISERLIDSEVKKQNLNVTIEKVEQEIRQISGRNNLSRAQLKQALSAQGIKFSEYQDFIKKRLERQALIEKSVTSKIKITDEDINAHLLSGQNKGKGSVFEYTIAQILFSANSPGAKRKAQELAAKLKANPKQFEEVATQFSDDKEFASGGLLGTFKQGEFRKEMQQAVEKVDVGQTTEVIESPDGFHILKLVDRKIVANPEMDKEKEKVRGVLYQEAFKKQFQFWLDQRRRNAFIRINTA